MGCVVCEAGQAGLTRRGLMGRGAALGAGAAALVGASAAGAGRAEAAEAARAREDAPRRGRPVVVEASWVLAEVDGAQRLLRDAHVVLRGDRVEAVGEGRRRGRDRRVRAEGQLLLPGLISGHTHVAGGTATRGIIEGGRSFARPLVLADELPDADLDDLTAFNLLELVRSGCTTQLEMALSLKQAESYVRVAGRLGARGFPGGMVPGIHRLFPIWFRTDDQALLDSVPGTLEEIAENLAFGLRVDGAHEGRIRPMMTPHATDTQTPETMRALADAARRLGHGMHWHLSQSARETQTVQRLWGRRPAQWLDDFGMYDGPLFGAHMSGLDLVQDPPLLRERGAVYAHCPSAGGAGGDTQPWPELLAAGVRTNIGIDTHSNDHVENVKLAVLYGQARTSLVGATSPVPLARPTIGDAVRAATVVPADGLRRPDLGRITPGAKADLVAVDVTGPLVGTGAVPPEPLNHLLYAHGLAVRHVVCDGTFLVHRGRLVVDDEARIRRRGGAVVQRLWEALRAEGFFTPTPA